MTRLTGEFHTDLSGQQALEACADAVHQLGWEVESVRPGRVSAFPHGSGSAPKIEFELAESGEGTDVRIVGSDSDQQRLDQQAIVAELDKARDAMTSAFESAEREPAEADRPQERSEQQAESEPEPASQAQATQQQATPEQQAPAGWYPDAYDSSRLQYWDGEQWTQHFKSAPGAAQPSETPERTRSTTETRERARSSTEPRRTADRPAQESGPEQTPARFRSLHLIASIYGILAWIVAILGTVGVIAATAAAADDGGGEAVGTAVVGALGVAFYVLLLFGLAAAIRLALAVEENTRTTTELLKERGTT
jgi:Protein of unknown function (DUF2510)